jgi:ferrochelatase
MAKQGVIICNIGTPESPEVDKVEAYLKEFLMDGEVVNIPYPARYILVNWLIVPKRKFLSAANYKALWTEQGSPLLVHTKNLQKNLQQALGDTKIVEIGMRYAEPSILVAMHKLKEQGVTEVTILPLYPQYARASTESTFLKVDKLNRTRGFNFKIHKIPCFYESKAFINAVAETTKNHLTGKKIDHYLMTYHGLPERQNRSMDPEKSYRKQCLKTSDLLAQELRLSKSEFSSSFQSRLGKAEWIKPYTDATLKELAEIGVKNLAVICPSFVADCLETIEEIGVEGAATFKKAGGENFYLVPCLNDRADYLLSLF